MVQSGGCTDTEAQCCAHPYDYVPLANVAVSATASVRSSCRCFRPQVEDAITGQQMSILKQTIRIGIVAGREQGVRGTVWSKACCAHALAQLLADDTAGTSDRTYRSCTL